jgi:hypothetical protein
MTKQKPTLKLHSIIRYWHPRKGGWYYATLAKAGRKWAYVKPLQSASNGIVMPEGRRRRVRIADVKEVAA